MLEGQRFLLAVGQVDVDGAAVAEGGHALEVLDLAQVAHLPRPRGQRADDLVLEVAQLVEIDLGLAELDAEILRVRRLADHVGDVQQRLGRDAAAIDADAAGILLRIDERDLHPAVGRVEGGCVSAGTGADDDKLTGDRHGCSGAKEVLGAKC